MTDFADTMVMHDAQDFVDARILEDFIDEPARVVTQAAENILPLARAARQDVWMRSRRTRQSSRDGSLRGLAAEVLGEERAQQWLQRCDPLEAPLLSACLMRRAGSSEPVNFLRAAAAVWV